jgi:curli biogenesis system outer membrane secretion channel CsgG
VKHFIALSAGMLLLVSCGTSTTETYSEDKMEAIGTYPPPPGGYTKPRAAIIEFQDKTQHHGRGWYAKPVGEQGGEQFETMVSRSDRFNLIERLRLSDLKREQSEVGTIDPSEIAKAGKVRGVDYMFMGAVTNFKVTVNKSKTGGGIFDRVVGPVAPLSIDTSKTVVKTDVGIDVKLVNTTTGEIVVKEFAELSREDKASAWGVRVLGIGGSAKNELQIDADSQGKILRWACDATLKKMLSRIDDKFSRPLPSYCPTCKTELPSGQKFCSKCGKGVEPQGCAGCGAKLEMNAKFCGGCGKKVEAPKPAGENK